MHVSIVPINFIKMISGLRLPSFEIQSFDPKARTAILELFSGKKGPFEHNIPLGAHQVRLRIKPCEAEGGFEIKAVSAVYDEMEPSLRYYSLNDLTAEGASDPEATAQAIQNVLAEVHKLLNDYYREISFVAEILTDLPTLTTELMNNFGRSLRGGALNATLLEKTGSYVRNERAVPTIKTIRPLPLSDSQSLEYREDANQIIIDLLTYGSSYVVAKKVFIFPKQEVGDRINWDQVSVNERYAPAEVPQEKLQEYLNDLALHLAQWTIKREAQLAREEVLRERRDALLRCLSIYDALKRPPIKNAVEAYEASKY